MFMDPYIFSGRNERWTIPQHRARQKNGFLISLYIFLPLLTITGIIVLRWKKRNVFENRSEASTEG